jgi:sugar phosphate isomerase/epimerase
MNRRSFIVASAVTAAGLCSPRRVAAIEPIKRPGPAKFKLSLAAYSYRDFFSGRLKPKLTLDDFIDDCAALGLEGTELTSYYFPQPVTSEYLRRLKQRAFRLGLDISGTAVGNDFCEPPGPKRDEQIDLVKRWVDYAEILGAPVIRIFSGNTKRGQSPEEAHRLAVAGIEQCCRYAGEHGVYLALENHGGLTETAEGTLAVVRDVKSDWFGVNLDTGNFRTADVYGDLAKLAPYAVNVQVKVVIHPSGGKREPTDYARLAKILRESGYRGYIVLEFEESGDPREECRNYVQKLRDAFR